MKQQEALDILKLGNNVFLTGPAGSGKTYVLNEYIDYLKKYKVGIGITASTGIAATHINGRTIHSWAKIGIKEKISSKEIKALLYNDNLQEQFSKTKVLVIDEISMLNSFRLDMVNKVCQAFKQSDLPFGGIQVVLCGDFFQLPPINTTKEKSSDFVYKSKIWNLMNIKVCYLEEQYRQDDKKFLQALNKIRQNNIDQEAKDLFVGQMNKPIKGKIKSTILYTHKVNVDSINNIELARINEKESIYEMYSEGDKYLIAELKKSCPSPETLVLKKGAVVMFVKNRFIDDKIIYVNGTLGVVVDFDENHCPEVEISSGNRITVFPDDWRIEEDDTVLAKIVQVPLRLAWAITVHKSQGMSLDAAETDLSRSFDYGMGYVALSRLKTIEGLSLLGMNEKAYQVHPEVLEHDKKFIEMSEEVQEELKKLSRADIDRMQDLFLK